MAKASLRDKFCAKAQVLTSIVNCVLVPFEYLDSVLLSRISLYEEDLVKTLAPKIYTLNTLLLPPATILAFSIVM